MVKNTNKKNIILAILIILLLASVSACQLFLGADADSSPKGIFNTMWNDFNETYALFEHKGVDWNDVYNTYSPQISSNMSDQALFNVLAEMIEVLNDAHVWIVAPFEERNSSKTSFNFADINVVRDMLQDEGTDNGDFLYGRFNDEPNIGYIHIRSFDGDTPIGVNDWARAIDDIVNSLSNTDGLILDVRNNEGGFFSNMNHIASRFVSVRANYKIVRTKNGTGRNDFSDPLTYSISPSGTRYTKPIVLLTNSSTTSASEWFTQALITQSHVIQVGDRTRGALSTRSPRHLINGWRYSVSVQYITDMAGNCYEATDAIPYGISPLTGNVITYNVTDNKDSHIQHAFTLLP